MRHLIAGMFILACVTTLVSCPRTAHVQEHVWKVKPKVERKGLEDYRHLLGSGKEEKPPKRRIKTKETIIVRENGRTRVINVTTVRKERGVR